MYRTVITASRHAQWAKCSMHMGKKGRQALLREAWGLQCRKRKRRDHEHTLREVRARAVRSGGCGAPGAVGTVEKLTAGDGGCGGIDRYASENGTGVTRKAYVRPGRRLLICAGPGLG